MRDTTPSNLTDCGLPGIKRIPYGVHMCHFYRGRDELAAVLVPYFAAGLRNRERGIWIVAEPLHATEAKLELAQAGVDVDTALADCYAGIRITGNVTFLTPETWSVFMEYEDMVQKAFSGRRIVTLCTYPADGDR